MVITAAILRVPAFQAGCREFEPRLPLFARDRCFHKAFQAALREASSDALG
jgi:hypothetical protein